MACTAMLFSAAVVLGIVWITDSADSVGEVVPWLLLLFGALATGEGARRALM
jgi:hypothetical protein